MKPLRIIAPAFVIPLRGPITTPEGTTGKPMGTMLPPGVWTYLDKPKDFNAVVRVTCPDWPCTYRIRYNCT